MDGFRYPLATLLCAVCLSACSAGPQVSAPPAAQKPLPTATTAHPSPAVTEAPAVGTLSAVTGMSVPRFCHTATLLTDGTVLIAGGLEREGLYLDSAEIFDPGTDTFRSPTHMTAQRACHTATLLADGRVLIAGGHIGRSVLASAEIYDPASGTFEPAGSLATARNGHVAVLLDNGQVLLAGGVGEGWATLASAELYDPATGAFLAIGDMTAPRAAHTATRLRDGRVLIAGGDQGRGGSLRVHQSAELYDPASGTFTLAGQMSVPRHKHAAALLPDGGVLVLGGSDERDWEGRYDSAEVFDPAADTFTSTSRMSFARFKLLDAVTPLTDGSVLVAVGGPRVETFDPASARFSIVADPLDAARFFSTATLLADGRVLIAGGYDSNITATARVWAYSP